ncbi:LicD family protein [Gallibacterium genomosp. 1]|uniref:2-C-methyl-D-erythritol 4-phosphate cytidylyltransferase n=1 Tax=Gallibacterium genomosp. 1 TaxID=155515 RepID=A0AB36DV91_9PAST|nr:LicD family protein [Gallibacterium genomosp. 1]OBX00318.1 2-C-methyl-D-erythritol 4-phosphate cytidylyltransferase [Gallibacterium genomosp. 1]OBX00351.1 2-C-methyl-D-erythritol 4-phosphate cytidylyltransferase [Gallibacterium genomosp. 1]
MLLDTTKEIQKKELEMLLYFTNFCNEHNLMFYLCGGGLIGAIRHQGFIPWDDDLDVFMPRDDYEKLSQLWDKYADKKRYSYCRTNQYLNYHDAGASIRDNNTTFINRHSIQEDICHGLALEIMPIDGCPSNKVKRAFQLFYAMMFSLFNVQRLPNNKGVLFRVMAKIIYSLIPSQTFRYKIWSFAEKRMMQYKWADVEQVTELIGSLKGMKLIHPKKDFDSVIYKKFEGHDIPVMSGYDRYLRLIWGDYMKLPPEKDRKAKHDAVYIDMNTPYTQYKGKYYCISERKK